MAPRSADSYRGARRARYFALPTPTGEQSRQVRRASRWPAPRGSRINPRQPDLGQTKRYFGRHIIRTLPVRMFWWGGVQFNPPVQDITHSAELHATKGWRFYRSRPVAFRDERFAA